MFPLLKTIKSLFFAKLIRLLIGSIILSLIIVFFFVMIMFYFSDILIEINIPYVTEIFQIFSGFIGGLVGWFMLPALVTMISSFFQERVIYQVEKVFYPNSMRQNPPRWFPDFKHDISFTLWVLVLNVLVLPFYFFGGIGLFLSIILNTYLLGREFFEIAAGYHLGKKRAKTLGKQNQLSLYLGGFVITCVTFIPILNLLIPILAVVWMVHLFHEIKNDD